MKKRLLTLFGLVFTLILITNISAGVYFSQPKPYYNLGDAIELNVSVDSVKDSPLKLTLVCDGNSADIFNGPLIDSIRIPLNSLWIGNLNGDCYVSGEYAGETRKTNSNFKISKKLEVSLSVSSFFAKPGEEITISGSVKRLSGEASNGEVQINIPFSGVIQKSAQINASGNESSNTTMSVVIPGEKFYGLVSDGEFSVTFLLPEKIPSGDYSLSITAYEKSDSGTKLNEGSVVTVLKVNQVLTSIDAAISNQNFDPGANLTIKPTLLDQAGNSMSDQVTVLIIDSDNKRIFERVVNSGESVNYEIPINTLSGYYGIDISVGDMKVTKTIYVNEKAIVSFEIKNGTLIVKNIGNIPYKKDIQIELNGKLFVKRVNLDVGESKEFKLTGVDGNYDVKISDGERELFMGGVPLTGNAIGVSDSSKGFYAVVYTPIFWVLVILILLIVVLLLARLVIKRRSVTYPSERLKTLELKGVVAAKKQEKDVKKEETKKVSISAMDFSRKLVTPTKAEQSMVVGGQKNRVGIIAIKIKDTITPVTKYELEKAIEPIYSKKGAVYEQGDYVIGILSPLGTKVANNEAAAAKAGEEILERLNEHNRKFKDRIEFGIGINSGEILNEIKDGKLKFTALGNTIILARKLAELSKGKVIISKEAYEKAITEIKADKIKLGDVEAYEVRKVVDHEQNKKFIDDFLKRNEKSKTPSKNYASSPYQSQQKSSSNENNNGNFKPNSGNTGGGRIDLGNLNGGNKGADGYLGI